MISWNPISVRSPLHVHLHVFLRRDKYFDEYYYSCSTFVYTRAVLLLYGKKMCGMEYISIISCVKMCIAMFIE